MILVAEGPSAAGKTTWARSLGVPVVDEHVGLGPGSAEYWAAANARRWQAALELERAHGVVVCDTDPLKLHYDFCLYRVGQAPRSQVVAAVAACRRRVESQELGIADLVLCSVPPADELRVRKDADPTRTRRRFDLHAQLAEPLVEWYSALETLDPGRVRWDFPAELPEVEPRDRYDLALFDRWMVALGLTTGS